MATIVNLYRASNDYIRLKCFLPTCILSIEAMHKFGGETIGLSVVFGVIRYFGWYAINSLLELKEKQNGTPSDQLQPKHHHHAIH